MKIKELYLWQMINIKKSLYIFYSIIYAIYLFSIVILKITGNPRVGGMDVSSVIYLFLAGLIFFGETFKFALCNGVSRKTILITNVFTTLSLTAAMTLIDIFNRWFFCFIAGLDDTTIFNYVYRGGNLISRIICTFGVYMLFASIGYFIGGLNSRMGKMLKLLVYITLPVLIIVGVPLGISILSETAIQSLGKFFSNFFSYITASPYNMFLVAIVSSVVFYIFSVFLVRKAPLKTE